MTAWPISASAQTSAAREIPPRMAASKVLACSRLRISAVRSSISMSSRPVSSAKARRNAGRADSPPCNLMTALATSEAFSVRTA
ncbi:hypothetical protein [Acrocarpospora corrugata]|uniref:hypothetical protein n=1 Tax=Acrocarpospora corrugata TaxID=35763 RepID=UPI0012D2AAAD|nr:hypothetical protein [Acrocarpospora corrugata]